VRKTWFAVAALFSLCACGKDAVTPLPSDISGTYKLDNVSGITLPVQLASTDTSNVYIYAGTLVLNPTREFTVTEADQTITIRHDTTNAVATSTGTYTFSDGTVTLHYNDRNVSVTGTYDASTVALSGGGIVFIYKKQ
jgi:hypothetical protein